LKRTGSAVAGLFLPSYLVAETKKKHPLELLPRAKFKKDVIKPSFLETIMYNSSLRENVDLEFLLKDLDNNPLQDGTIALQGISNDDYLEIQQTNNQGLTNFIVEDGNFFYFFGFKQGYHPEAGAIFSDEDKTTELNFTPFGANEWQFYYRTNDEVEMSFFSNDPDTIYERGDEFNYEVEVGSVSDEEVHLSNTDMEAGIYSENGDPVMIGDSIWGSPNDELEYDIYFNPRSGWLRYTAEGNNVTAQIGEAHGIFDGVPFDISGDGEWVGQTIITNDNVVPNHIEQGLYNVQVDVLGLQMGSQNFQVNVPVGVNGNNRGGLEKELLVYPNPSNGKFNIKGYNFNEKVEIFDIRGRKVYEGAIGNINSNSYSSGTYIGVINGNKFTHTKLKWKSN